MSIPEQKFAVGECVMVRSVLDSSIKIDSAIVTHAKYAVSRWYGTTKLQYGWLYHVDEYEEYNSSGGRVWIGELSLRKRPEPGQDWESLRDDLKLPQVEMA